MYEKKSTQRKNLKETVKRRNVNKNKENVK